jgi:hypothetical protein
MRGELPLPPGVALWTPYGIRPSRGNATGNDDGLSATCEPTEKCGWERRYHHVIFVVDRDSAKDGWVIDDQLHVIHKFTYHGKLVMMTAGASLAVCRPAQWSALSYNGSRRKSVHCRGVQRPRTDCFRRKPGADPAKVVGQELRYPVRSTN